VDERNWTEAWTAALDDLELGVADVERALRDAHLAPVEVVARVSAWRPPLDLGPLPAPLQVRANAILQRQLATARKAAETMTASRRQLALVESLRARPAANAVYVDTQA